MRQDLIFVTLDCLNKGLLPLELNQTLLVLIPTVKNPVKIKQFCLISLCNVVYKTITKAIINKLKPYLPQEVSPNQSSFIPGCNITDNVIIYQEVLHSFRTNRGTRKSMMVKIDLEKAYDRLEWYFIETTLQGLGLFENLIKVIMLCISSVTFRVLWNRNYTEEFVPTRGIGQGDPLSPYLFVLCLERLG